MARIYVADDDMAIRNLLTLCLIEEGHEVLVAKDGESVLQTVIDEPPDVLVLDIMMPRMDGFQVLDGLNHYGVRQFVKVLFLTARGAEADRVRGLERGADEYLAKPFEIEEFLEVLRQLLASTNEDLQIRREEELTRASLLARLESVFEEPGH